MDIQDFVSDESHAYLLTLKEASALPDYVKQIPEEEDLQSIPSVAFAASSERKFPVHDKTAAFLSSVYAFLQGATKDSGPLVQRLKTACALYGIEEDVQKAQEALASETVKEASVPPRETRYALELSGVIDDRVQKFYPISTAHQIEESARKMASDISEQKLPLAWFADAAEELHKAASEIGIPETRIPTKVRKLGRPRLPDPQVVDAALDKRANEEQVSPDAFEIYREAADMAVKGELPANEAALVWQTADRKFGVHNKYAGDNDPLWVFKSGYGTDYIEKAKNASLMIRDALIPKIQLDAVPDRDLMLYLTQEDAENAILAKRASTGPEAGKIIERISDKGCKKLALLILKEST